MEQGAESVYAGKVFFQLGLALEVGQMLSHCRQRGESIMLARQPRCRNPCLSPRRRRD
jgi:hypothetical protein